MRDLARYLSAGDGPVRFVLDQIVLPTGDRLGAVIESDLWIRDSVLAPVFEVNVAGLPRFSTCAIQLARGHAKTGLAAAVALTEALLYPSTEVIVAAVDADQAALLLDAIHGYLARNDALRTAFTVNRQLISVRSNGSRIRVISSDVASSYGVGGTHRRLRIILEELSVWPRRELYDSLMSSTGKTPDVQAVILSNAGFDKENSWQYQAISRADYVYAPEGVIASWITREWVARMLATLPPATAERLIFNRWVSEVGDFVSAVQLDACIDPQLSPRVVGLPTARHFAGLDLGLVKDRTALAVVHRSADGAVVLDALQVWQGTKGAPVEITEVERALLEYAIRFPRLALAVDPWQLKGTVERLRGRIRIEEFPFTSASVSRLSESLFGAITGRQLRLYPDPALRSEILGLRTVQTASGWRVDHRAGGFSDRAMALGMAIVQAMAQPVGAGLLRSVVLADLGRRLPGPDGEGVSLADTITFKRAEPEPETVKLRCLAEAGHVYYDRQLRRDFNWQMAGDERWVPMRVAALLLAEHGPKGSGKLIQIAEREPAEATT